MAAEAGRVLTLVATLFQPPVAPVDLFVFDDAATGPVQLHLTFQRRNRAPGTESQTLQQLHRIMLTPEGVVITRSLWTGFWFIPRADLDAAIRQARDPVAAPQPR